MQLMKLEIKEKDGVPVTGSPCSPRTVITVHVYTCIALMLNHPKIAAPVRLSLAGVTCRCSEHLVSANMGIQSTFTPTHQ